MTDNQLRTAFIELGMPDMGFEAMGWAVPTKMERRIFEVPREPEPYFITAGAKFFEQLKTILNQFNHE